MRLSAATRQANVTGSLTKQTGWLMEPPTMINVTDFFAGGTASTLIQVVVIDLVMAGDNAIVIALAAAGLRERERKRAIMIGILAATALRLICASIAVQLLQIVGPLLAGGILLLWVCWKMWRELHAKRQDQEGGDRRPVEDTTRCEIAGEGRSPDKTFGQATLRIVVADVSMSLDNVLAVAGAARNHPFVLAFGLLLSIALMGIAANLISKFLQKQR